MIVHPRSVHGSTTSARADNHKLRPEWLRRIDTVLEDETVLEVVVQALEARWPQSRRRGRPGTPADVVIRQTKSAESRIIGRRALEFLSAAAT